MRPGEQQQQQCRWPWRSVERQLAQVVGATHETSAYTVSFLVPVPGTNRGPPLSLAHTSVIKGRSSTPGGVVLRMEGKAEAEAGDPFCVPRMSCWCWAVQTNAEHKQEETQGSAGKRLRSARVWGLPVHPAAQGWGRKGAQCVLVPLTRPG